MTPAGFQAAARALAIGAGYLLLAVLAFCTAAALVQAAIASFDGWRAARRYRRAFAVAADPNPATTAGLVTPGEHESFARATFVRPHGARPPLDS